MAKQRGLVLGGLEATPSPRTIDADETVAVLERLAAERGAPENLRADNGPELTARALRDWCEVRSTATAYIDPGAPWQNAWVESLNARFRDEVLDVEEFANLAEARFLAADWQAGYNHEHPHSALVPRPRFTGHSGEQSDHATAVCVSASRCSRVSAGVR